MQDEWAAYYQRFYSPGDEEMFKNSEGFEACFRREQYTLNRIFPLVEARGGFPCETEEDEQVAESEEDDYWESEDETTRCELVEADNDEVTEQGSESAGGALML